MEEIIYKIEVEDAGASKAATDIANSLNKVDASANKSKGALGGFTNEIGKAVPAVGSLTSGFKALIATPVGLVLAAVSAAIGVITAAIKRSQPALDLIEDAFEAIGTIAHVLLDNLKAIGQIIGNVLIGNFAGAADGIKKLTNEVLTSVKANQLYIDTLRDLEDQSFRLRLATADEEQKIKALVVASKNRNLTLKEQSALLEEALKREKALTDARADQARAEAVAGIKKLANDKGVRQSDNETFDQFVKNLVNGTDLLDEEKDKVVALYEKMKAAASDSLAFQEKVQNMQDGIAEKRKADVDKQLQEADDLRRFIDKLAEARLKEAEASKEAQDIRLKAVREGTATEVKITTTAATSMAKAQKALNTQVVSNEKITNDQRVQGQLGVFSAIGSALGKFASKNKAIASASALINTFLGVTEILKAPTVPFIEPFASIVRAIQIGTVIATGIGAVRQINSAPGFAKSGLTGKRIGWGDGIPIQRSNGDNILATVKKGEVILNERHQDLLGGASTFARIGVPGFADSGFVSGSGDSRLIADRINSQNILGAINDSIRNMPRQVAIIEEIEALSAERIEIKERATV